MPWRWDYIASVEEYKSVLHGESFLDGKELLFEIFTPRRRFVKVLREAGAFVAKRIVDLPLGEVYGSLEVSSLEVSSLEVSFLEVSSNEEGF
jgi:hypothetical protein